MLAISSRWPRPSPSSRARVLGLLGYEDLEEAAVALEPGTFATVLLWENRWAAPVAAALRRSGGQLVASGRLPIQAIIAALDAVEASNRLRRSTNVAANGDATHPEQIARAKELLDAGTIDRSEFDRLKGRALA